MQVAITGASGLIGSALADALRADDVRVRPLVRRREQLDGEAIYWNVRDSEIDTDALEGVDAVVHLAGENVAGGRWSDARKARIRDSRTVGTALLAGALASLRSKPKVLLSASAIGIYGDRGDETLTEDAEAGEGFLAEVCVAWEAAAAAAADAGLRVVHPRIGIVLSKEGGALAKMKTPFQLGMGGRMASGRQWMSWVHLEDVVRSLRFALETPSLRGAYNAVAPAPARNADFTKALGRALGRPTLLPVPGFALKLAVGGAFAEEALLASARCVPGALADAGFRFAFPDLDEALASVV